MHYYELLINSINSNAFLFALVRFSLASLAASSSFHIIFYQISTHDDLLNYFERVEYPDDALSKRFRRFRRIFMVRYSFLTGLGAAALLAIQYPDSSQTANATAVFYGILGPWAIRDQIMILMKGKASSSVQKGIIDSRPDINKTADTFLNDAFNDFEKKSTNSSDSKKWGTDE